MNRTESIINYIVYSFRDEPLKLGKLKLAKILWFVDREFMHKYYKQLTDLTYIKMPLGPVPKKYDNLLKNMEKDKILHIYQSNSYGDENKTQICFHSLIEPDIDSFGAREIQILEETIRKLRNTKGSTLSKQTHNSLWNSTKMGDIMPVESVFWNDIEPPTTEDIEWAQNLLDSKGIITNAD